MTTQTKDETSFDQATTFTMIGTQLLKKGRSQNLIALAPQLWLHAKVYSDEAERHLHAHDNEDHAFFVLSGKATFRNEDEEESEVGPFEGIMIPRGVRYAFDNTGEGNLVILRIGAGPDNQRRADGGMVAQSPTVWTPDADRKRELDEGNFFNPLG